MADSPAPDVIGLQRERVQQERPIGSVYVQARLRFKSDPGPWAEHQIRIEIGKGLLAHGRLEVPIVATYPLSAVAEAYKRLAGGHFIGKIVLMT